jgi:hypothetical protein
MVGGNVIEGSFQNLKGACTFIEECFLKFWVVELPGLYGMRPPFCEHYVKGKFDLLPVFITFCDNVTSRILALLL